MNPTLAATITIRRAVAADAAVLARVAESGFVDAFAAQNDASDMEAYVATAFGEAKQRAELSDPAVTVFLAERLGDVVGYTMLRDGASWNGTTDTSAIEIARLYATRPAIGSGVGSALMQHCLHEARARGKHLVWLGVWERNARAIAFYNRWGFVDVGSQPFQLGADRQTDRVMARAIVEQ